MIRSMCLAESGNGVDFTVIGTALQVTAADTLTDPSIIRTRSGQWLMAMSNGTQTVLSRSADGLSFAEYSRVGFGGVPELAALPDGRIRLYVCKAGIESYVSEDAGNTWTREATVVPAGVMGARIVCDPSLVAGTDLFVFKVQ